MSGTNKGCYKNALNHRFSFTRIASCNVSALVRERGKDSKREAEYEREQHKDRE